MIGIIGLIVVTVGAFAGVEKWWRPTSAESPSAFVVERRDFPVTLLQKGELKAAQSVDIRCEVEGRSTIIWLIPEGTEVKKGDLLVQLASDEIDERIETEEITVTKYRSDAETAVKQYEIQVDENASDIRKAERALEDARIELEKYLKGDWEQQQTDASIALEQAKKELAQAENRFNDSKDLFAKGFITEWEYEADEFALFKAHKALEKAELAQLVLHKYTHHQDLTSREAAVEEARKELERVRKSAEAKAAQKASDKEARQRELEVAEKRLAKYRALKEKTRICAPAPGLVVYYAEQHRWGDGDQVKEGAEVRERQTLISLPDTSLMKVEVRIHESVANKIKAGMPASVEIEGIYDRVFTGKVTRISTLADSENRWLNPDLKEYTTEITLDPTEIQLKPGVTARARIHVEVVNDALAVPVQAVFAKAGRHYVFREEWGRTVPVPVEVGSASEEFVDVLAGLQVGDRITLAPSDDAKREIPDAPMESNDTPDARPARPDRAPAAAAAAPAPRERRSPRSHGRPPR